MFSLASSRLSFGNTSRAVIGTLCFFHFWLSATVMSEYANKKTRGAFIVAVFGMQCIDIVFAGLVSTIVSGLFVHYNTAPSWKESHEMSLNNEKSVMDCMWR